MFCRLEDPWNLNSQTNTSNLEWKVKVMSLLHEQSEKLREQQETSVGKGRQGHGVRSAWRLGQWLLLDVEIISGVSGIVLIPAYLCDVFIGVRTCWSSRDGKWCVCQSTEPSSSMSLSAPAFWNTPIMFGKLAQESFGSFDQTQTQKKRIRNRAFLFEPADSILPANRGTLKSAKSFKLSSHLDIFENALSGWGSPAASAKVFLFLLQGASLVRLTHVNTDFSMIWSCFQNYLVRRSHLVASPCKCCPWRGWHFGARDDRDAGGKVAALRSKSEDYEG